LGFNRRVFGAEVNAGMNYRGVSRWYESRGIATFLTPVQQRSVQKLLNFVHTEYFHPQVKTSIGSCLIGPATGQPKLHQGEKVIR
jgi:hypothetical protein